MSVTMADVARLAGVNKATVSRALKGDHRISPSTREKVWNAAKSLGYEPDAVARGLSSQRTDLIGVVFPDLNLSSTGFFLAGLERVFSRHKLELLVKSISLAGQHEENIMRNLRSRKVDGIVWFGDKLPDPGVDIPVVSVGFENLSVFSILLDVEKTMKKISMISEKKEILLFSENIQLYSGIFAGLIPPMKVISEEEFRQAISSKYPVICTDPVLARATGSYCLDIPLFEMGAISGRLILNAIQSKGVRPSRVMIVPSVISTSGDLVNYLG